MDNGRLDGSTAKLLAVDANGALRHLPRTRLSSLFSVGDLIVANDAATLPASLVGHHCASCEPIEVRLAAWVSHHNPREFAAIAFGSCDHRTRTEDRSPPPPLASGDRLALGPLTAVVEHLLDHPRLFRLRFLCESATILAGLAQHGRPIQYAHVPKPLALWDVWTRIAADPIAFEAPSAGFALDWRTLVLAATRNWLHRAHPRRGNLLDRRSGTRCATAFRRALPHPRPDRGGDRSRAFARLAHHRHWDERRPRTRIGSRC
jgi:S-adenosylmethionine:tRNA ribosyltransferase-isomerase